MLDEGREQEKNKGEKKAGSSHPYSSPSLFFIFFCSHLFALSPRSERLEQAIILAKIGKKNSSRPFQGKKMSEQPFCGVNLCSLIIYSRPRDVLKGMFSLSFYKPAVIHGNEKKIKRNRSLG